ncbi:MAG TPA: TonB-dependent receptor [Opitutaceae bacterium]|nr:TonB-dependent receptor [Opitutaceae bacterium]
MSGIAAPGTDLPVPLESYVVTASRALQSPDHVPFSLKVFEGDALRSAPTATLDGALRSVPGFSLFRRSDSLTANPTAQGVSLRGLGPSGASRSLILLDGVPLNDPFGGWVAWTLVPRESLARAEIVRGGGATAWGNAALGGVVHLITAPENRHLIDDNFSGSAAVTFGDYGTRSAEFSAAQRIGGSTVQFQGRSFETDGFSLVAPERRGLIDVPAASRHAWIAGRWRTPLGENLEATFTARTFAERRNNGTPYQRNSSRSNFGSVALAGEPSKNFAWNAVGYAQDQGFSSTFSSVNATRTAETPASDQFAVPSTAAGAAWTGVWSHADGAHTSAGVDARRVRGETRERFTFVSGAFTRLRVAGGTQAIGGLFALHEQPLTASVRATIGARLDQWRETDGHRRESDLATNVASRDERYPELDDTEFSPSAGLVWTPAQSWRVRIAAQQAFRRPTLNELYRPFRVGANVTEANPALRTERVTSGEAGLDFTGRIFSGGAAVFWNDLEDAVGNVTLARGPGTFPLFGTLGPGAVGRQRLNLERARVRGVELSASWRVSQILSLDAAALLNDSTVRRAATAPALVGKQLAQVPRRSATLGATWRAPAKITVTPRVRWIGRQFEDDENTLRLGEVVVADLGASRALTKHLELFLTVENLGNARIETGRSVDGVVNTGTPRLFLGGLRGSW